MNPDGRTLGRILGDCRKKRIGMPMFAYTDVWDLLAIVRIAERMKTDIIVGSNPSVAGALGVDVCHAMASALAASSSVSIFNELDHSSDISLCIKAVDAGYSMVMIDGSARPLKENIEMTSVVVKYAHERGVLVEGEIGKIKGSGSEGNFRGGAYLAETDEVVEFVEKTGVDLLAVGIGTAHGFYTERPRIRFDRLSEIARAVDIPLVLHGGTGIPDEDIRKAISLGITKVNVGTIIHTTYLRCLREQLNANPANPYTPDIMRKVLPQIEEVVGDRIRAIAGDSSAD